MFSLKNLCLLLVATTCACSSKNDQAKETTPAKTVVGTVDSPVSDPDSVDTGAMSKQEFASAVRTAFEKEDASLLAAFVHPTKATGFRYTYGLCDPENPDEGQGCGGVTEVTGFDAFAKAMKELVDIEQSDTSAVDFGVSHGIGTCNAKCCEYTMEGVSHGTLWLSKVCFVEQEGALFITEIEATDES